MALSCSDRASSRRYTRSNRKSRSVSSARKASSDIPTSGEPSLRSTRSVTSVLTRPERVVHVVVDVRDAVGEPDHLRLEGGGRRHGPGVVHDPVADLPAEVEPAPVVLKVVHDPEALLVVAERPAQERREGLLAQVPERRVAQVVAERDGLGQVLVQAK